MNTGWTGGPFGEGERMPIKATRALLDAALAGELDGVEYRTDPVFGFAVPVWCRVSPDAAQPTADLVGSRGVRREGARARRDVPRELHAFRRLSPAVAAAGPPPAS